MARTTAELIEGIVELDNEDDDLEPFITAANALVTEKCAGQTTKDGSLYYDSDRLALIETWLAAHFYCIRAPRSLNEMAGDVQQRIESKVDLGLNVTRYGQMAMVLDTAGGLSALNEETINTPPKRGWGALWMGRRPELTPRRVT